MITGRARYLRARRAHRRRSVSDRQLHSCWVREGRTGWSGLSQRWLPGPLDDRAV